MKKIPPGLHRFNKYILLVNECLVACKKSQNPAKKLYESKARTYFFMLESLARIYKTIHAKKAMKKLEAEFKTMEDLLGKIDFYDALNKQQPNKKFKLNYLKALDNLNNYLLNRDFLSSNVFSDFCFSTLKKVKWLPYKKDRKKIKHAIEQELKKIIKNIKTKEIVFDEIESGVHELRRNLRWISIYTQSLNGLIQLQQNKSIQKFKKYRTKEVLTSPFNNFPSNTNKKINPLKIDSNNFYALSYLIMELGKIKDKGLLILESEKARNNKVIDHLLVDAKTKTMQFVDDFEVKHWFVE